MSNFIFIHNTNNLLGEKLISSFKDNPLNSIVINEYKNIKSKLQEDNIFIFNTDFTNELKNLTEDYADQLCNKLENIFKMLQSITNELIYAEKKGKFLFITTNPKTLNLVDAPCAPIYDEAIFSLVKSLTKELNSFNLRFNAITLDSIFEEMDKTSLRNYAKKMKPIASRKTPTKLDALINQIHEIVFSNSNLLSGTIYNIGEGMYV